MRDYVVPVLLVVLMAVVYLQFSGEGEVTYFSDEKVDKVSWELGEPNLDVEVYEDSVKGYNLYVNAPNFSFNPENVNSRHLSGQGHAHIYLNGVKHDRIYNRHYYLYKLPDSNGKVNLTVSLHSNDHRMYYHDGKPVMISKILRSN